MIKWEKLFFFSHENTVAVPIELNLFKFLKYFFLCKKGEKQPLEHLLELFLLCNTEYYKSVLNSWNYSLISSKETQDFLSQTSSLAILNI